MSDNLLRISMTLPPALVARLDTVAPSSPYRTRSALAAHLLASALADEPIPPSGMAAAGADTAAGTGAPSPSPAAPQPGGLLKVAPPQPAGSSGADAGRFPASVPYPASLHCDALIRSAAVHTERAEIARQQRERVLRETAKAMKGIRE